jgi:hypothetical protein
MSAITDIRRRKSAAIDRDYSFQTGSLVYGEQSFQGLIVVRGI